MTAVDAVVFDLDGVIIESEEIWDDVRERYVLERAGHYDAAAQRAMMGMSSLEWSRFMQEELGVAETPETISADVVSLMTERYRERLPLIHGASSAVERLAAVFPLGLASSSNRPLIDVVLERSGLERCFRATVSSEEVAHGKPAPDVYLEAARRLGVEPARCIVIEDSHNGIRSAKAAGMQVIAIPNPRYPPDAGAVAEANTVLMSIAELTPALLAELP